MLALKPLTTVQRVVTVKAVIAADHAGYKHSKFDWWIFDAFETSPKTCPVCKALESMKYRGDRISVLFPYHVHRSAGLIKARVHQHCRCRIHWVGRTEAPRDAPGTLTPEESMEIWGPSKEELLKLTPSQFEYIMKFLRSPWK